jgi:cytochrome c oxidase subunit II
MLQNFPLFPEQASTMAPRVDALFFFLVAVALFFASLIFFLLILFAVKYRRRSDEEQPRPVEGHLPLEILWTAVPLGLTMVMFVWGAMLFFEIYHPPSNALEINVVGKQWMWKIQHPEGQREINELHVPVGRPVKLTMTSEDVIHDFFVPAFRVKKDVLPGGYTTIWFQATKAGEYHLFCSQYCGTQHSGMIGKVVVMELSQYEDWLSGGPKEVSLATAGEMLFQRLGCGTCHRPDGTGQGPSLVGLFGKPVNLQGGRTVTADESYIRESILDPRAKIVAKYPPVMPTFKGLVSEDGLLQIIAYIKSLQREERSQAER